MLGPIWPPDYKDFLIWQLCWEPFRIKVQTHLLNDMHLTSPPTAETIGTFVILCVRKDNVRGDKGM